MQRANKIDIAPFAAHAQSLFKDSAFTDFEIKCDGDTYHVHRAIVAYHSSYFSKLFRDDYLESRGRIVELGEDNPAAVKLMIDYFNGFDYDDTHDQITAFFNILKLNAAVYTVADKYDVPGLKEIAGKHFAKVILPSILRNEDLTQAIELVFTGTPPSDRTLREIVLDHWMAFEAVLGPAIVKPIPEALPVLAADIQLQGTGESTMPGRLFGVGRWFRRKVTSPDVKFSVQCNYNMALFVAPVLEACSIKDAFTTSCGQCGKSMAEHKDLMGSGDLPGLSGCKCSIFDRLALWPVLKLGTCV